MIVQEERNRLIEAVEGYMDERIKFGEFDDIIYDILCSGETQDATVLFVADELDERVCGMTNDTIIAYSDEWSYYQRLLLILKSGTEVTYSSGIYKKGYYPFRNFADIKKVYKSCEGFKKKKYPKKLYEYFGEPEKPKEPENRSFWDLNRPIPMEYLYVFGLLTLLYMIWSDSGSFLGFVKNIFLILSGFIVSLLVILLFIYVIDRFSKEYYFKERGEEGNAYFVTF